MLLLLQAKQSFHADVLGPSIDKEGHVFLVRKEIENSGVKGDFFSFHEKAIIKVHVIFLTRTALFHIAKCEECSASRRKSQKKMLLKISMCNHNVFT